MVKNNKKLKANNLSSKNIMFRNYRFFVLSVFLIFILTLTKCDLWEEYKINFIDNYNPDIVKFELFVKDWDIVTSYNKFLNGDLLESGEFFRDSLYTGWVIKDSGGKVISKQKFIFEKDTLAKLSIDTTFYSDSMRITKIEYGYAKWFLNREHINTYTIGGVNQTDVIYRYIYSKGNIARREVTRNNRKCTDEMKYSDNKLLIDIDRFSNRLLGLGSHDLVMQAVWQSTCYKKENIAKPVSDFTYELNSQGYVTKKTIRYTPDYDTTMDNNIERITSYVYYEYVFE